MSIHVYIYICIHVYVYNTYIYTYIYIFIYLPIHTSLQRDCPGRGVHEQEGQRAYMEERGGSHIACQFGCAIRRIALKLTSTIQCTFKAPMVPMTLYLGYLRGYWRGGRW